MPAKKNLIVSDAFPTLTFASADAFDAWLSKHGDSSGVWIKMAKKATGIPSVAWDEAVDVALCHGWIDGQRNGHDDAYFLQKFTPRRPRSIWSKRNIAKVEALTRAGRMRPRGLAEVERAKQDGRWEAAYGGSAEMTVPEDFLKAVKKKDKRTREYFASLKKAQLFAISFRLHTAKKPETRQRRMEVLLGMLEKESFK